MVPVAAFLSVLARPAIDGPVPAFLFDASTRGSGKTLQADVVSLLATGRGAARATYPKDEEELAKVLMAYALSACPTVLLDNITRTLGGGVLDAVLTARDDVQFPRARTQRRAPRLPWRTVLFASGNNLALGEDTIRAASSSPASSRTWRTPRTAPGSSHPDLFGWGEAREASPFVAAGLTVLRSFASHGRPECGTKALGHLRSLERPHPRQHRVRRRRRPHGRPTDPRVEHQRRPHSPPRRPARTPATQPGRPYLGRHQPTPVPGPAPRRAPGRME